MHNEANYPTTREIEVAAAVMRTYPHRREQHMQLDAVELSRVFNKGTGPVLSTSDFMIGYELGCEAMRIARIGAEQLSHEATTSR